MYPTRPQANLTVGKPRVYQQRLVARHTHFFLAFSLSLLFTANAAAQTKQQESTTFGSNSFPQVIVPGSSGPIYTNNTIHQPRRRRPQHSRDLPVSSEELARLPKRPPAPQTLEFDRSEVRRLPIPAVQVSTIVLGDVLLSGESSQDGDSLWQGDDLFSDSLLDENFGGDSDLDGTSAQVKTQSRPSSPAFTSDDRESFRPEHAEKQDVLEALTSLPTEAVPQDEARSIQDKNDLSNEGDFDLLPAPDSRAPEQAEEDPFWAEVLPETESPSRSQNDTQRENETEKFDSGEYGEFEPARPKRSDMKLPPAEPVVPLRVTPAPKDFSGYGNFEPPFQNTLPDGDPPPAYQWPKKPSEPTGAQESPSDENAGKPSQLFPWQLVSAEQAIDLQRLPHNFVHQSDPCAVPIDLQFRDFLDTPLIPNSYQPCDDVATYYGKRAVPTQRPLVELGRPFYGPGLYPQAIPIFSDVNPLMPAFAVYGDYRTGVGIHRVGGNPVRNYAHRLNLDMDLRLTGTERFHAFMGPLDHNGRFTRLDFSDSGNVEFEEELDAQFDTAFFEGDLGSMWGGLVGEDAPFDLPIAIGLMPLVYQNGIWLEDALAGAAVSFPWRHSRLLNWSNFDATFFVGFDQVTSPAFAGDNSAASVFGTAWFIEAYGGYIEADYAYLNDRDGLNRSYHNFALAYTRRYFARWSNSVRYIGNLGQSGPLVTRTADGGILLVENSLISSRPSNVVPYANFFVGHGRPQSVARAGGSGGILRNTGIHFESDGLTGYPTLDATGSNAYGGAVGINFLSADFTRQFVLEFAALDTYGDPALSAAAGPQYALGTRWQKALNNWSQLRADLMYGWLDNAPDLMGSKLEFRWKF